jgi:membrane protease YdiL (CAAX protease family)
MIEVRSPVVQRACGARRGAAWRTAARPSTGTVRLLVLPSIVGVAALLLTLKVPPAAAPIANLLFQWAMYVGWGWWALATARALDLPYAGLLAAPSDARAWRLVAVVVPLITLTVSGFIVQAALLVALFPAAGAASVSAASDAQPMIASVLLVLTGVTLVPLVEEVVFRGVLLRAWTARFGEGRATLGTALAFGVLHHDVLGAVAFAIVMAVLYRRSGSLLVPVAVHAAYNAVTGIATLMPGGDEFTPDELRSAVPLAVLVIAASALCLVLALRPLRRFRAAEARTA